MEEATASVETEIQGDIEYAKKMEDEHLRLQRQFRQIQTDRLHRTMGVHPQFRRQDQLLKILKEDYISLNKDLKIASTGAHKKNSKKMKKDLHKALLYRACTDMECEGGLSIMEELEGLLQIKAKDMLRLRKVATANQGEVEARRGQSENRLRAAENKLETATLRFNMIQYENKQIREEIEHMLKDRALFNQAWGKMMAALGTGKKFLSDLFESSTLAYDQRDEWCTKLRSIQEKGKMDQMLQVQEMRDMKKAYDHEMKVYNFLAKKGVIRINKKQEEREEAMKKKIEKEEKQKYEEHAKILDEIHEYTEEPSYRKIIEDFVKREQENFAMYKLLTDYCAENEVLDRDVKRIRRDIEDRRDQNEMMITRRDERLEDLRKKVEEQSARTEVLQQKNEETDQLLNGSMEKIHDIFKMLDCSLEPFQNLLGDKQPSLHQLSLSLRLITEKIQEYIEVVLYTERSHKRTDKTTTSRLKKYTVRAEPPEIFTPNPITLLVPADPCPSCIETRWMSRVTEAPESPFEPAEVLVALQALVNDPAYVRSDRVHALADCRATASRRLLATRHTQF